MKGEGLGPGGSEHCVPPADVGGTGADEDGQDNGVADMAEVELKQDREAVEWDEDDGFKAHEVAAAEKVFMYLQVCRFSQYSPLPPGPFPPLPPMCC